MWVRCAAAVRRRLVRVLCAASILRHPLETCAVISGVIYPYYTYEQTVVAKVEGPSCGRRLAFNTKATLKIEGPTFYILKANKHFIFFYKCSITVINKSNNVCQLSALASFIIMAID